MNKNPLRASTVACVMAFLAFPAVADTTNLIVHNRGAERITSMSIGGAGSIVSNLFTIPAGGLAPGNSVTMNIECGGPGTLYTLVWLFIGANQQFSQRTIPLSCPGVNGINELSIGN